MINDILYLALNSSRTTALTKMYLRKLSEIHEIDDANFCGWRALAASGVI